MKVCDVFIEQTFLNNETLTYALNSMSACEGGRVFVKLQGRRLVGMVHKIYELDPTTVRYKIQPIEAVIDDKPLLTPELLACAKWMSYQTISPYISCIQTMLPNALKPKSSAKRIKMIPIVRIISSNYASLTPKQRALIDAFEGSDVMRVSDARKIYPGYLKLVEKGILARDEIESFYVDKPIEKVMPRYDLSLAQREVLQKIQLNEARTYVLHGITGSGKTEVYLNLAQQVLDHGQQVLFLVPEISLTPQMIERVSSRFGQDVAIYHSALNDQEKYEQYKRVLKGEVKLVVGTRSASFLPFSNLGALIMDEEHDESYKQSNTPYYHTRDVLQWRSDYHTCPLILGSASPALESYARALKGVYTLLELPSRINDSLPEVEIVDTQEALHHKENANLTQRLQDLIKETLDRNEQVILLLNRRGYLTWVKDVDTDAILTCPHCDVSLNYHARDKSLRCHVCGYQTQAFPKNNDGTPVNLIGGGVGTQRLEHWLHQLFPNATIMRMDRDTTRIKNAHENILSDFNQQKIDILIGTQMIAKGLDNPHVTLVGIINIDASLARNDYRSVETTFDLILQAAGRSGRGDKKGRVVIQTFNPNHYAVVYGSKHQYKAFFKQEMTFRAQAKYPPYRYLIAVYFKDKNQNKVLGAAHTFVSCMPAFDGTIIGPYDCGKMNDTFEYRIILKGKNLDLMIKYVQSALESYRKIEKVGVSVDVNPLTLMA
ncbi:primosomal protein N' [Erysipelothrix larvae]|uniref:Replication restart protein PriA n=1 Tax=Erysipelothrix larvae TaxID=1514105 RepID=A0A0X8GZV9_9FIRM|nr:primosomal protein N' [Erysipelothrix larvae]AMC93440.1 primosomal protein N' [Erysipelothrix larvae]